MVKFENVSALELETVEGGMIKIERAPKPLPYDGHHTGGGGYTGIMVSYTLTVSEHQSPC